MDFSTNYTVRTDMADEILQGLYGKDGIYDDGIYVRNENFGKISVERTQLNKSIEYGGCKKEKGRYATVTAEDIRMFTRQEFETAADIIADEIRTMLPEGHWIAVCLGNRNLVADAVGPLASVRIIVSRHIKKHNRNLFESMEFGECACMVPGVLGETGIEAAELIKSAVQAIKPSGLVVIDALACARMSRLMKTVQICDTGISPGSGVNNSRAEISKNTMGVPVVAVGVPTVVDVATICRDFSHGIGNCDTPLNFKDTQKDASDFFVTVKDADSYVKTMAKLIGFSFNKAIHKNMSFEEMEEFLS